MCLPLPLQPNMMQILVSSTKNTDEIQKVRLKYWILMGVGFLMCFVSVVDHHLPTVAEMEETSSCVKTGSGSSESVSRRHYRRLPDISNMTGSGSNNKGQSSRSFDSGICVLLSDSGSPSPPLAGDTEQDTCQNHVSHLSTCSSSSSPVPPRSPITPSKRASFHAYSPAKLPKPPVPPNSPCFKNSKPSFFSSRRFSEQNASNKCSDAATASSRTLSPISVSPSSTHKSPSPSFSSSSKSSPQLQRSIGASASLQSTESSESPPKSPEIGSFSPAPSYSSPCQSQLCRRKLPETPTKQKMSSNSYTNTIDKNIHTGTKKNLTKNFLWKFLIH